MTEITCKSFLKIDKVCTLKILKLNKIQKTITLKF